MKKLQLFMLAVLLTVISSRADTSYLLMQGPFGAASVTQTFKWKVDYLTGSLITGQDLLNAVFGMVVGKGTYTDGFGGTSPYFEAGNSTQGAGYTSSSFGLFLISVTLGGTKVLQDPSYSPGWNYYVAGGTGTNHVSAGNSTGAYSNSGAWSYSDDGTASRHLANGSFDAFVYGNTFPAETIAGTGNTPAVANFAGATPVSAPEPTALLLLASGLFGCAIRRRW